ncbi:MULTISPECIES: aldehyde dehydrogenase family protein [Rhizobium/Agrobacterium group]|uniref:Aldehyde dehydrogenase family protein n=1 Tax=Rhizobium rhizogenes TaxID=359 RepID=A0A546X3L2_RHIRH|nr:MULTISPECIES: aldehyde dehydrogenase family protein [Rhizobium/Agrobacterium group]TRA95264.1 aldehyde dehydrogenase family protein [Rhizobium rhizogenes]
MRLPIAHNYIDGTWITEGERQTTTNPATGEVLGHYVAGSETLANQAISCARQAFDTSDWASTPRLRAEMLLEFSEYLSEQRDQITDLIVAENGKLKREALGEVNASISEARYYAGLARAITGRTIETEPNKLSLMNREAAGVAGIIVPWNAPVTLLVRSLAPALAAGCTTVIKPALQTPLIHSAVLNCLERCEALPRGVVNSVNESNDEVGKALVASDLVDVISFTGSSATGKNIMRGAASSLKRLSLELGGKAPAIIFADADLESTLKELLRGALAMAGQVCVAATRFLIHKSIEKEFTELARLAFAAVKTGPGSDPSSQMGALIDIQSQSRLARLVEQAGEEGEMILKGRILEKGAFITPTLFKIQNVASELVQEELFGPIVSIETFEDEDEAIRAANATKYGLAASVFTNDINRALRVSRALRVGTVWHNCHGRLFAEGETGGYRHSGFGRLHGVEGLNEFLETKHVYIEVTQNKNGGQREQV